MVVHAVDAIGLRIEGVITQLVPDDQEDQQTGRDPQGQAQYIDEREAEAAANTAEGGEEVVREHGCFPPNGYHFFNALIVKMLRSIYSFALSVSVHLLSDMPALYRAASSAWRRWSLCQDR